MGQHYIATDCVVRLSDRESISGTARRERLEAEMCQQSSAADVPWIRNNECSGALMKFGKSATLFSLSQHAHSCCGGSAKVPSTTCTKFLSSRRMIRLLCASAKFARASESERRRARYVSYAARLSNAINPQATSFVPSCGRK